MTGKINEETTRSLNASSNSVAAVSQASANPAAPQLTSVRPDTSSSLSQASPPPSLSQPDRQLDANTSYSASFYQFAPVRLNRRIIAGAQYQLMSRGYYRRRVAGKYGRQTAFAVRAFQSNAGLPPTGRLDLETVEAFGSPDTDFANLAPASPGYESWMPVRKFKHGKWKMKWKRYYRPFDGEDGDEDRQANSEPGWNPYNED